MSFLQRGCEQNIREFANTIPREEVSRAGVWGARGNTLVLKIGGFVEAQRTRDHHAVGGRRDLGISQQIDKDLGNVETLR